MWRAAFASLALLMGSVAITPSAAPQQPDTPHDDLLDEVWRIVNDNFHDPNFNGVDWPAARERCAERLGGVSAKIDMVREINAMLDELKTSHTHLYRHGEVEYFELADIYREGLGDTLKQHFPDAVKYTGIGVRVRSNRDGLLVTDVYEASPAHKGGVRVGDVILSIDDLSGTAHHPQLPRVQSLEDFQPHVNKEVRLVLRRDVPCVVTPQWIVPHELFLESVRQSGRVIERDDKRLAYVRIRSYASPAYQELLIELLTTEPLRSCDGLILDIRGGWGGANPEYLNTFNRDIPLVEATLRDGQAAARDRQWRKPVVLLVDEGTRSGKEILAHAFKTRGIGKVVGTRTAGAVMGGRAFLLSDGSLLVAAVTDVRVDGGRLEGVGVEPDVVVEQGPIESLNDADPQLQRAAEVLATEIKE